AAVRAVENWPAELHGYPGADDVRPSMRRICLAVRHTIEGRREDLTEAESLRPLRPVLDALRREFIATARNAEAANDPESILRVLDAMEGAQRLLDDTAAERFAARLSGTDA